MASQREEVAVRISAQNAASAAFREARADVAGLESATAAASSAQRRASQSTTQWGQAFKTLNTSTVGVQSSLNRTVDRGVVGLGALTVGAVAWGLQTASSMEQSQLAFETMFKSADKAKSFTADLASFAKATPFDLPGLTTASQRLLAYGFDAESVLPTLTALGDASAGFGGGAEGLASMTRALGQIKAKGRVQTEELLQFQDIGVPALEILGKGLNLTGAQLQKAVEGGLVSADKAIPILTKGLEDRFGGLMARQSQTFGGQMSNLRDATSQSLAAAILPVLPILTKELPVLSEALGSAIKEIAPQIPALVQSGAVLLPVMVQVGGQFAALLTSVSPAVLKVTEFLGPDGLQAVMVGLLALRGVTAVTSTAEVIKNGSGAISEVLKGAETLKAGAESLGNGGQCCCCDGSAATGGSSSSDGSSGSSDGKPAEKNADGSPKAKDDGTPNSDPNDPKSKTRRGRAKARARRGAAAAGSFASQNLDTAAILADPSSGLTQLEGLPVPVGGGPAGTAIVVGTLGAPYLKAGFEGTRPKRDPSNHGFNATNAVGALNDLNPFYYVGQTFGAATRGIGDIAGWVGGAGKRSAAVGPTAGERFAQAGAFPALTAPASIATPKPLPAPARFVAPSPFAVSAAPEQAARSPFSVPSALYSSSYREPVAGPSVPVSALPWPFSAGAVPAAPDSSAQLMPAPLPAAAPTSVVTGAVTTNTFSTTVSVVNPRSDMDVEAAVSRGIREHIQDRQDRR